MLFLVGLCTFVKFWDEGYLLKVRGKVFFCLVVFEKGDDLRLRECSFIGGI